MTDSAPSLRAQVKNLPPSESQLYQKYDLEEETTRLAYHYDLPAEFFYTLTGGEWHVYSCSLWEAGFTMTQAQAKKLDKLAEFMQLKPGMHILDVGCGWGGPLVYLCHTYGVTGHGITVTPSQIPEATARAARYGVKATFEVVHWKNLPEVETYDAIYSDEVLVHFNDLGGFFAKCYTLLKPGGRMVHKEVHFGHTRYCTFDRVGEVVSKVYADTGNYVPLHKELRLLDENNFALEHVYEIPMEHYYRTMDEWLKNNFEHRQRLKELVGPETYKEFRTYLKAARLSFTNGRMQLHIVASRKMA